MGGHEIHQGQDVGPQAAPHEFTLAFDGHGAGLDLLGDRFGQCKVDHETLLTAELAGAGLLRIVQHIHIRRACVETAEPDRIGSQQTLRVFDRGVGPHIDGDYHLLIDTLEELRDRLSVRDFFPFDRPIFTLPHQVVEKRRKTLERLHIHGLERPDKGRPIGYFRMQGFAHVRSQELFFDIVRLPRHQFRREVVPQFVTEDAIHAAIRHAFEPVHGPSMCLNPIAVGRKFRMSQRGVEHRLLPIDQHIANAGIDRSVYVKHLEVTEKTGGKVAVAGAEFQDRERGCVSGTT